MKLHGAQAIYLVAISLRQKQTIERHELQLALMEMPPVAAETSAGSMLETDGTDLSQSRTRS